MAKKIATEKKVKKSKKLAAAEAPVKSKKTKKVAEAAVKTKKSKVAKVKKIKTKAAKAAPAGPKPIKEKMNKTQLLNHLVEQTELDKKDVKKVMDALEETMLAHVRKKGAGEFMMPGLFKIVTKHIPAKKARKGINPFTKEETVFKAKPATTKVKVRPMKKLKDMALI